MLKTGKFAALAILGALAINPAFAEDKSAALVNGVSIPQARIDLRQGAAAQGRRSPEMRKAIRDDLINLEVISQEALKKGLDKQPDVAQQIELTKQSALVGAFVQDYAKTHPVSDQLKKEYDNAKTKLGDKEYKARHILVETEDEAKDIIANWARSQIRNSPQNQGYRFCSARRLIGLGSAGSFVRVANALLNLKKGSTQRTEYSRNWLACHQTGRHARTESAAI
jgi:peptidyl-prolyl cis-trans isomerase C